MQRRTSNGPLIPLRSAVILLLSVLAGLGAGILMRMAGRPMPLAALSAIGVTAAAVTFFNALVGD